MVWTGKIGLKGRQKDALDSKVVLKGRQKGGLDGKIGLKGRQMVDLDGNLDSRRVTPIEVNCHKLKTPP